MLKRNLFTLVELLVVVGIIAILAGMILPAVVGAQQQGRITQAKSDMSTITMALKGVENTYGKIVTKDGSYYKFDGKRADIWKTEQSGSTEQEAGIRLGDDEQSTGNAWYKAYFPFIAELTVPAQKNGSSYVIGTMNTNKRRISFLEPQSGYNPADSYSSTENKLKLWRDPWGSQYCILIRTSSSVYLEHPAKKERVSGSPNKDKMLSGTVSIYSFGPNAKNDYADNATLGGPVGTDDIASWE